MQYQFVLELLVTRFLQCAFVQFRRTLDPTPWGTGVTQSLKFCIDNFSYSLGIEGWILQKPVGFFRSTGPVGDVRAFRVHFNDKGKRHLGGFSFCVEEEVMREDITVGYSGRVSTDWVSTPFNLQIHLRWSSLNLQTHTWFQMTVPAMPNGGHSS